MSSGGRYPVKFGSSVRVIQTDGTINDKQYIIDCKTTDHLCRVKLKDGSQILWVHYTRIISNDRVGNSIVLKTSSSDKVATCPHCKENFMIIDPDMTTPTIEQISEEIVKNPVDSLPTSVDSVLNAEVPQNTESVPPEPLSLVFPSNVAVWINKPKAFINEKHTLQTLQLVIVDENPRKMVINLYDGQLSLNKKGQTIDIQPFLDNKSDNKSKSRWHKWLKIDPEKYAGKLIKDGYELQSNEQETAE